MVGRNVKLYDMVLQFLRTLFLRTRNVHYCTLRAELLMSLHDLDVGDICSVDPCHKVGPCGALGPAACPCSAASALHGAPSVGAPDPEPPRPPPCPPRGLSPPLQSPRGELLVLEQGLPRCPVLTWMRCDPPTASLGASWRYTLSRHCPPHSGNPGKARFRTKCSGLSLALLGLWGVGPWARLLCAVLFLAPGRALATQGGDPGAHPRLGCSGNGENCPEARSLAES